MHPIERIHFVELNAKLNTLAAKPIFPKYGTPLLAAIMKQQGYQVRIYLDGVSDMSIERIADCDLVCLPVYAPALNKVKQIVAQLRRARPDLPIVTGGPFVALYPEAVLGCCDFAVRCEGDEALPELVRCIAAAGDPRQVSGISFRSDGAVVHTPDRPPPMIPETIPDLTLIEGFERAARGRRAQMNIVNTLQTSRGCRFRCRFCPTSKLFGDLYRNRDIDSIVADIRAKLRFNPFFFVVDNSFLSNRERTVALLHRLARERLGAHLTVFERHEIGRDPELLQLMKQAGVRSIIVGIESLDDENLRSYSKQQKVDQVKASIESILRSDIHVIGTFVVGGDGDRRDTFDKIVSFVRETGISPNLFVMHDVEQSGSRLLIPLERRFKTYYDRTDPDNTDHYDYCTGNFVTYFPKNIRPSTLQRGVIDVYRQLSTHRQILRRVWSKNIFASLFGVQHGYAMRRMSRVLSRVVDGSYLDYLKQIERGLYDNDERLIEQRLGDLRTLPIPGPVEERVELRRYRLLGLLLMLPGLIRHRLRGGEDLLPRRLGEPGPA